MAKEEKNESSSQPPGWILASQWGMNLVVLTCFFGYLGFFIGDRLQNKALSFFLTLTGIMLGFALGVWRMVKASEKLKSNRQEDDSIQK